MVSVMVVLTLKQVKSDGAENPVFGGKVVVRHVGGQDRPGGDV